MFDRIDLHLDRPICEHLPTEHKETWRWYCTQSTDNGAKRVELHIYCQVCKKRFSIKQKDIPVQFMLNGKPATEQESPLFVSESADSADAAALRLRTVKHERGFTKYDESICKKLGIQYEGP